MARLTCQRIECRASFEARGPNTKFCPACRNTPAHRGGTKVDTPLDQDADIDAPRAGRRGYPVVDMEGRTVDSLELARRLREEAFA